MADQTEGRVAVYIDFDNIVISRYDELNGNGSWRRDNARSVLPAKKSDDPVATKLWQAEIDVSAILDYASSFGVVALSRAYADWSVPVNASYRKQLVNRAVDLTQLFPVTKAFKNGADIRLSVDVLEDLFRLPDLTHVVIVAGDSDYIALAQRCKRLGRYVLGIGVAGRTSTALVSACDHFEMYDAIPGAVDPERASIETAAEDASIVEEAPKTTARRSRGGTRSSATTEPGTDADEAGTARGAIESDEAPVAPWAPSLPPLFADGTAPIASPAATMTEKAATRLLLRALELLLAKDDEEWKPAAAVKTQIRRLDPSFSERSMGHRTFTDFLTSRASLVEVKTEGSDRFVRLR
ncbi:NYN domain-containing protein [Naasia lichenicola]|nr:NYN domain-containing protein [Naasia lichenicola]